MVKIFILYGNSEGEKYAKYIDKHFKQNGLDSFLASYGSPDVRVGGEFQKKIDIELENADIVIIVVTAGLRRSVAAMDEINRILGMTVSPPIIPYVKGNTQLPIEIIGRQVLSFKKSNVNTTAKKNELELTMWRTLDSHRREMSITPEQYQPQIQSYGPIEVQR